MTGPLIPLEDRLVGTSTTLNTGIETCDAMAGFSAIRDPGMELVICRRALPSCLQTWLERMDPSHFPSIRVLIRPKDFRPAMEPYLDGCGMPPGDMRTLLLGDFDDLVSSFARITRSGLVDVRLERVSNDSCWKFHRDCVTARLLTTYRGPATEWVQPIHAEQALREQQSYKGPLERLLVHDVAIFKGNRAGPDSGIVHRSPPIVGTGRTRWLLCLNKRSVTSPEPWPTMFDKYAVST